MNKYAIYFELVYFTFGLTAFNCFTRCLLHFGCTQYALLKEKKVLVLAYVASALSYHQLVGYQANEEPWRALTIYTFSLFPRKKIAMDRSVFIQLAPSEYGYVRDNLDAAYSPSH